MMSWSRILKAVVASSFVVVLCSGATLAADCGTALKSSDGYKELSEKLKCIEDRIKALEGAGAAHAIPKSPPASGGPGGVRVVSGGGVEIAMKKCVRWNQEDVYCSFDLVNSSDDDKKVCFFSDSRIVTDKGESFGKSIYQKVGAVENHGGGSACDAVPPKVRASGLIQFSSAQKKLDSQLQLVRLSCGGSCVLNAYNVPVE